MKKRILTLLAAVCLLSAVLSGCGGGSQNGTTGTTDQSTANTQTEGPAARAAAGELNVGIAQDLDSSLDPHKTVKAGTREVMFNVFEGLLKPDASGNLNPAVAESYTVSEDHLLYTFKLRTGVKFHNGQEVTPEDVIWSYQRCGDVNAPADIIQVAAFANVEMYQEGDDTVCFQLQEPNNEFTSYLTTAVLPKDYTEQDTAPVGTGPFKFVSRTAQESVVLERFDDYWGEKPDLTKVTYKIIENADSILLSLQSGAVDVFAHLTTNQIQQLGDGFHVEEGTMNLVQALYLNNAEKPFDDVRVRQALCYAIDRQQILDLAFDGYGTLLGSSMYPAFSKYFDDELTNYYTYNTEKGQGAADGGRLSQRLRYDHHRPQQLPVSHGYRTGHRGAAEGCGHQCHHSARHLGELGAGHLFQPAVPVHCGGRGCFQHDRTGHAGAVRLYRQPRLYQLQQRGL